MSVLMSAPEFNSFRLVGGTSLSLQLGHRISVDIDLFSDVSYGTLDFEAIDHYLEKTFPYLDHFSDFLPGMGKSYIIGSNKNETVKLDVYYTDPFIQPPLELDGIRLATLEEIIAMKIDVVQRGGRKKDFWDLHELLLYFPLPLMLELHQQRYGYNHDAELIIKNFTNFASADDDFDPICLRGKYWEFIKEDLQEAVNRN